MHHLLSHMITIVKVISKIRKPYLKIVIIRPIQKVFIVQKCQPPEMYVEEGSTTNNYYVLCFQRLPEKDVTSMLERTSSTNTAIIIIVGRQHNSPCIEPHQSASPIFSVWFTVQHCFRILSEINISILSSVILIAFK